MWSKHFVGVFLKRVMPEKVNVYKGFQAFGKPATENRLHAPKPSALPLGNTPMIIRLLFLFIAFGIHPIMVSHYPFFVKLLD